MHMHAAHLGATVQLRKDLAGIEQPLVVEGAFDAKLLVEGGYTLDWVQPVGQFRWSTHVELAGRFSRK